MQAPYLNIFSSSLAGIRYIYLYQSTSCASYGPHQRKLGSDFGRFQERKMRFVAICGSGQPFSWTGVGVRWIKAGIFTIDVAQSWQDFQQSPTLRLLGIWHNLGNIKVSLSLHTSPKNCTIPSQIIAEIFLWTRYKKKCCRITSRISGIQGTAVPQGDEAKNGRLLLSLLPQTPSCHVERMLI